MKKTSLKSAPIWFYEYKLDSLKIYIYIFRNKTGRQSNARKSGQVHKSSGYFAARRRKRSGGDRRNGEKAESVAGGAVKKRDESWKNPSEGRMGIFRAFLKRDDFWRQER